LFSAEPDLVIASLTLAGTIHQVSDASTLMTVNNLGVLYYTQDKLDEAEKMYHRALQGRRYAVYIYLEEGRCGYWEGRWIRAVYQRH
jgi:hypothetical protein